MKSLKSILPWVLVVLAVGGAYAFFSSAQTKESELVKLRAQVQELDSLRAENAELKKLEVQHDELIRLRKDNEDVLRLRNEVRKLRDENKQVSTASQTAARAQVNDSAQVQQLQIEIQQLRAQLAQQANPNALSTEAKAAMCMNHLRQIDGAKQQWAQENNIPFGTVATAQDLLPYLPNHQMPACPTGGAYSTTTVGANPACTVPGHSL